MDTPHLVCAGFLDGLLPIVVMIAFAVLKAKAETKKRQRLQEQADAPSGEPKPSGLDALLRSLEERAEQVPSQPEKRAVLFGEPERVESVRPPNIVHDIEDQMVTRSESLRVESEDDIYDAPPEEVSSFEDNGLQQASSLVMNMKVAKLPSIAGGPRLSMGKATGARFDINFKDRAVLRKAVLMHEVLGKPKGMELG